MLRTFLNTLINAPRNIITRQICPYCFSRFNLIETPFRCINPKCKKSVDSVRETIWGDTLPHGLILETDKLLKRAVIGWFNGRSTCKDCKDISSQRLCPKCHMELPLSIGETKNYIFAMIGSKWAGKSHFLASLHEHFKKKLGPQLDILMEPLDDRTIRRYRDHFFRPVFQEQKTIDPTRSGLTDLDTRMPLVFSLTFTNRKNFWPWRRAKVINLVFFDSAGEDLTDSKRMAAVNRYICSAHGLILLLDPLQLKPVRDRLPEDVSIPPATDDITDIIKLVTNLIRDRRNLSPGAQINTHIAVSFTKFDVLETLLPTDTQLRYQPDRTLGYDVADSEAVDTEVQSLLESWNCLDVLQQIRTHFKNSAFFGLSALGCNPHGNNRIPEVKPKRIEDPFLWLLYKKNLLRPQKQI